ncbi:MULTISPECIES: sensor histidine kinase [unclassified Curtobacterium]|uniref:sensor histidine kinase n=1 Tax=unclassified Curtobacterium TaxID=257496 RepID=UPI00226B05F0|nr:MULTISPECIES: HAMP domain-containing sensor histidine kinase [unclassified Curtobacterium]
METATWYDGFTFDPDGVQTWATLQVHFAFVDDQGIAVATPDQAGLPSGALIDTMVQDARRHDSTVYRRAPQVGDGAASAWAAERLPGQRDAVVLVGTTTGPSTAAHDRLVTQLVLAAAGLTVAGAATGHLLSGLAMRPALRGIEGQEQFLREAAHELRTPLATMRLGVDGIADADAPAALRRVGEQVARMSELTHHLLVRARLRAADVTGVTLTPLRLDLVVERVIEEMPDAGAVRVQTVPVVVDGHPELLGQLVRNLVQNALDHGAPPVQVVVGDSALSVIDSGADPVDERRPLRTAPGTTTSTGTGSGLAIVAWVVQVHEAALRFDTTRGGGLDATVTFPQRTPTA